MTSVPFRDLCDRWNASTSTVTGYNAIVGQCRAWPYAKINSTLDASTAYSDGKRASECRIDFGPGYRVYFGKDGDRLVILLGGGTKKRQQQDINSAVANWQDYKRRK